MEQKKCIECGKTNNLKRGWTNAWYCSERCEKRGVAALHNSMPGGPSPSPGWIFIHTRREITGRWE